MACKPWRGKRRELHLVNAAVDRELDDYTKRETAMQGRASILIGAASVIGAIQLTDGVTWWSIANLALSLLAAVAGVVVVFPRRGHGFNPRTMRDAFYDDTRDAEVLHHTVRVKIENLEADERSLRFRGKFARAGFVLLAASILAAALGTFYSTPPTVPEDQTEAALHAEV